MKLLKWLSISFILLLLLVAGLIFFAPTIFGDRIRQEVDKQLEAYIDADIVYGDVDFSLLKSFPKLSMSLNDLHVDGRGAFDTITLAEVKSFTVAVDFWSAVGDGPIQIRSVELDRPKLHVVVRKDGLSNTDILRNINEAGEASTSSNGQSAIALERYQVIDGALVYDDRSSDFYTQLLDINHIGKGDFTASTFDLSTQTSIAKVDLKSGGVTYMRSATVNYVADINVDTDAGQLTLADNRLKINELELQADGAVGFPKEDGTITAQVSLTAPKQDFRALWSVIPAVFAKDLSGLKTSGSFGLTGTIQGDYVPSPQQLPSFAFDLSVNDASVQYPDLPKALTDIDVKAGIRSAGADLQDLLIDVERFKFALGDNPFAGSLQVKQGITDPRFDLAANGTIDLADLSSAIPLEGVDELSGKIALDIKAKGSAIAAQNDFTTINSSGLAKFDRVVYVAEGTPNVSVNSGLARFDQDRVDLENFDIQAGSSDIQANGSIVNPFAVMNETGVVKTTLNLTSNRLDANEFLTETSGDESTQVTTDNVPPSAPFERFEIAFDATINSLIYDVYELKNASSVGNMTPEKLSLKQTTFTTAGSDINLAGNLENLYGFAFDDEELTGTLKFKSNYLDLLALSETGTTTSSTTVTETAEPAYLALPENMSIRVATVIDKLLYDDIAIENVSGVIAMANQGAVIENGTGNVIGGKMKVDGGYQYNGPSTKPTFDLNYEIQNASFKQAFEQLNTVQTLAPIAKFLEGSFNTNMVMSSALGTDMLPDLKTLSADGFLATLNATIQSFGPLEKASNLLGIKELKGIDLSNTKNWFTIQDGTVEVKPFDVKMGDIDATLGGKHGIDKAMDYEIIALVPREKLQQNTVGAAVNTGLDFLGGQASKLGLDLNAGEFVRVKIGLTGDMADPKVDIKLLGTEGQGSAKDQAVDALKAAAKQARDSIEREAKARLAAHRAEAEAKARAVADSVRAAAEQRARAAAEEAKAKAKAEADRLAKKAADQAKARAAEEARKAAEAAATKVGDDVKDKAKDALKGLFGKKKKPD